MSDREIALLAVQHLATIAEKIDGLTSNLEKVNDSIDTLNRFQVEVETRLNSAEKRFSKTVSIISVTAGVIMTIMGIIAFYANSKGADQKQEPQILDQSEGNMLRDSSYSWNIFNGNEFLRTGVLDTTKDR